MFQLLLCRIPWNQTWLTFWSLTIHPIYIPLEFLCLTVTVSWVKWYIIEQHFFELIYLSFLQGKSIGKLAWSQKSVQLPLLSCPPGVILLFCLAKEICLNNDPMVLGCLALTKILTPSPFSPFQLTSWSLATHSTCLHHI